MSCQNPLCKTEGPHAHVDGDWMAQKIIDLRAKLSAAEKERDDLKERLEQAKTEYNHWNRKYLDTKEKLAVAMEALTSISKNGCCGTCQEAKLVSLKALKVINGG